MARYLYSELSSLIQARKNCANVMNGLKTGDVKQSEEWFNRHEETIESLVRDHMPSGSGFDSGTKIDLDASHADKLVFTTLFHHMDEYGYYDGWTEHTVTVTPSLANRYHIRISGRNRNDIKDLIHEAFSHSLDTDVEWDIIQNAHWVVKEHDVQIKSEWIDESRQRWFVVANGQEIYTPKETTHYAGTPIERCKAFAVEYCQRIAMEAR
jgi:hypothetical protein